MFQMILRGLAAGAVVIAVSEIAARFPRLGAVILTVPIVVPIVFVVTYLKLDSLTPVSHLAKESLILIPLGLPFFVPLAFAEKLALSFWPAFCCGVALAASAICFYLYWATKGV